MLFLNPYMILLTVYDGVDCYKVLNNFIKKSDEESIGIQVKKQANLFPLSSQM